MESRYDVIVIGAGLAGLCAALQAAQLGAQVRVLESHEIGGRAQSDQRRDFIFNRGPHALFNDGEAAKTLRALGLPLSGSAKSLRGAKALFREELHVLPISPTTILRTDLLNATDRISFARVMAGLPKVTPVELSEISAREWCEVRASSSTVASLLQAFIRLNTYCNNLDGLSAEAGVTQLRRSLRGVTYLDGGWQTIVEALATRAQATGVEISTHDAATTVECADDAVRVASSDATVEARSVVLACGGPGMVRRLVPELVIEDQGPLVNAACLDLGLTSPPIEHFVLGIDEDVYLSLHSPPARLAPEGAATLSVMAYGGEGKKSIENLDRLARLAGVSHDDIAERRTLANMTVAHSVPRPGASFRGRPSVTAAGVTRCFLAGDWVGERCLLADAAVASGTLAGKLAAQT